MPVVFFTPCSKESVLVTLHFRDVAFKKKAEQEKCKRALRTACLESLTAAKFLKERI